MNEEYQCSVNEARARQRPAQELFQQELKNQELSTTGKLNSESEKGVIKTLI